MGDDVVEGECTHQLLTNEGLAGGEAVGPGHCGGVVTPCCCMLVQEIWDEVFQDQTLEQHASHLKVIDGEVSIGIGWGNKPGSDVCWPFDTPDSGVNSFRAAEPNSTCTPFASITEPDEVRPSRHKLGTVGWAVGNHLENGLEILKHSVGIRASRHLDVAVLLAVVSVFGEKMVEGPQQTFAIGYGKACMLEFSQKGLKLMEGGMLGVQHLLDGSANLLQLAWGQLNGAVDAIKDPAQDFFVESPDPFTLTKFLEGDWFRIWVGFKIRGGGKDGVDGMEKGPRVVQEGLGVRALEGCNEIVNMNFQEVLELPEPFGELGRVPFRWVLDVKEAEILSHIHGGLLKWVGGSWGFWQSVLAT